MKNSVRCLSQLVREQIRLGAIDEALRSVHDFVEGVFTEPLCAARVFGSEALDELCSEIGRASLARLRAEAPRVGGAVAAPVRVYLVSKLQKSGGHTRVIEDLIRSVPHEAHIVLSTEICGRSDVDYAEAASSHLAGMTVEYAPKGGLGDRLAWLQARLREIRPARAFLFNHHQDSVAVAALQPEMGIRASYVHHGDHHLCLGVYLAGLEHIDLHPMGFHTCRDELKIENYYLPLTVVDRGPPDATRPFMADGRLTTCTAARSNKIELPYFVNYLDVIPELLKETGGRHVHIGRLTPWARYRLRRGMKRLGVPADRLVYIPWVPSVWTALIANRVDLYLASFPYGGALTLIEAMGAGVPVMLHRHIYSRLLSCLDLAYPRALSWSDPAELLAICKTATPAQLQEQAGKAREQYERFHRPEVFEQAVLADAGGVASPPLTANYPLKTDEMAAWVVGEVSVAGLLRRAAYRLSRRLRAVFA